MWWSRYSWSRLWFGAGKTAVSFGGGKGLRYLRPQEGMYFFITIGKNARDKAFELLNIMPVGGIIG